MWLQHKNIFNKIKHSINTVILELISLEKQTKITNKETNKKKEKVSNHFSKSIVFNSHHDSRRRRQAQICLNKQTNKQTNFN